MEKKNATELAEELCEILGVNPNLAHIRHVEQETGKDAKGKTLTRMVRADVSKRDAIAEWLGHAGVAKLPEHSGEGKGSK